MIAFQGTSQVRLRIGNDTLNCYTDSENRIVATYILERDMYKESTEILSQQLIQCDSISLITDDNVLQVDNLQVQIDTLNNRYVKSVTNCINIVNDKNAIISKNNKTIKTLGIVSTILLILLIVK